MVKNICAYVASYFKNRTLNSLTKWKKNNQDKIVYEIFIFKFIIFLIKNFDLKKVIYVSLNFLYDLKKAF